MIRQYEVVQKLHSVLCKVDEVNAEISGSRHVELEALISEGRELLKSLEPARLPTAAALPLSPRRRR